LSAPEIDADEFASVVDVSGAVGEGGVAPENVATAGIFRWLEQFGAADEVEAVWRQASEEEFTLIVPDPISVLVFNDEGGGEEASLIAEDLEAFPVAIAGGEVEAAEFAEGADAVEAIAADHRGAHDGGEAFGDFGLSGAASAPDWLGGFARCGDLEEQGALVEGGDEESVLPEAGHSDGDFGAVGFTADRIGLSPEDLTGFGVESTDGIRVPHHQMAGGADIVDGRWGGTDVVGVEGAPELLAGILREGDDGGVGAPDHTDEAVTIEEGV